VKCEDCYNDYFGDGKCDKHKKIEKLKDIQKIVNKWDDGKIETDDAIKQIKDIK